VPPCPEIAVVPGLIDAIVDPRGARLGFRHALVHDAAYSTLVRSDRRRLHGIVGRRLESTAGRDGADEGRSAVLAGHFMRAEDWDAALRHAVRAASDAAAAYATDEAIDLYAMSITAARELLAVGEDPVAVAGPGADLAALLEERGSLLRLPGRYGEAEQSFREALDALPPDQPIRRARFLVHLGSSADDRQAFDEERAFYDKAEAELGSPITDDPDWWDEWIHVRFERAEFAYWMGETGELVRIIGSLEGPIAARGTPENRAALHGLMVEYLHRRDRYVPSGEAERHARLAYAATKESGARSDVAWAEFHLAFTLLWNFELDEAERRFRRILDEADHLGNTLLTARAVTYLSICLRRLRKVEETRRAAERTVVVSRRLHIDQYVAIGLGNLAWAGLVTGDPDTALERGEAAMRAWPEQPRFGFHWVALWPLIAAHLARGRPDRAAAGCAELLDPDEQPPAPEVADALARVLAVASSNGNASGSTEVLGAALTAAVEAARRQRYL
jgi:tetratricopeptide (TPR) repeat protein